MSEVTAILFCTDCEAPMVKEQKNQLVWWVCTNYPHCAVTAFEYHGKPKFTHEAPNIKPPPEMPFYLDIF